MKKLSCIFGFIIYLIVGLIVALPVTASAATDVSGIITTDTTWTLSDSPYIVTGGVLVDSGVTLTIEPGVIVSFDGNTALQIEGTLIAIGTDTDNIIFTSNQPIPAAGDWGYIIFSDSSTDATYDASGNYMGGSILEYSVIEYGGSTDGALLLDNAHPFINYCTIMDSSTSGIMAFNLTETIKITNSSISNNTNAIRIFGGTVIISGNTITDNTNNGIFVSNGIVIISDNIISDNTSNGIYVSNGTATISDNTISDNTDNGIYVLRGTFTISDNTISNNINEGISVNNEDFDNGTAAISGNTISNNSIGIGINGGTVTISGNTITYNTDDGISTFSITVTISDNTISDNAEHGIDVYGAAAAIISYNNIHNNARSGIYVNSYTATISYNNIRDNTGSGIRVYSGMTAIISYNNIRNNTAYNGSGISVSGTTATIFGNTIADNIATGAVSTCTVFIGAPSLFNYNDIFNNTATYKLCNDNAVGTPNVDATNNWWGTSVESEIQASIYDWFVDISKGTVDYYPFLLSPDAEPEPNISADIESWDFGNIDVGDSANRIFIISNIGAADLAIGDLSLAGNNPYQFNIQNDNCSGATIASRGSCTFEAVFSPTKGGALSALIGVNSNDPDTPALYINLSGIGILQTFTIKAVAGANGSISPSGDTSVDYGEDQTFTITPALGYQVADVLVDYVSVGPVTTYTFSSITSSHTIIATFAEECKNKSKR